jgi:methyltransferase (TIGR00027 family)
MLNPVATTGLLVAAMRAEESNRTDRLFVDPYAALLAGERGRAALASYRAAVGPSIPIIEVRTRFFDEALLRAQARGARQFVIVAAGMDARAYRLDWGADTQLFELDQPEVIAGKAEVLDATQPRCSRHAIALDLTEDWTQPLAAAGFEPATPTTWLVEGLLQYLDAASVEGLFERIDRSSRSGSTLLYDVVGEALLHAPPLQATLAYMRDLGAPWIFGSDQPLALIEPRGWDGVSTDPAVIGNAWGRWPFPAAPAHVPGVPRGYLVEATKR